MRHSGDADKPRILGTFNEPMDNWLSFYMFTYFTDRDGKFQLKSFAESAFDPLARTTRFMLTEEAHHMFVGETGVGRVIKRTLEVMKELDTDDVATLRKAGVIDLPTIQKYMNFWFTSSLDLFGSEASSNAANYFSNGIKGRPDEARFADHVEAGTEMTIDIPDGRGGMSTEVISTRNGMNEVPPAYILRPTARWAYCTGIFRCACVMAMTPPMTTSNTAIKIGPVVQKLCAASVVPPWVENMSIAP